MTGKSFFSFLIQVAAVFVMLLVWIGFVDSVFPGQELPWGGTYQPRTAWVLKAAGAFAALSAISYLWQRYRHEQVMRRFEEIEKYLEQEAKDFYGEEENGTGA